MGLDKNVKIVLDHVKISKGRFRKYIGTIGEIVAREVLRKRGFEVWLVTAYFPEGLDKRIGGRLINVLNGMYKNKMDRFWKPQKKRIKEVKSFFGDRLEDFKRYMEKLGVIGKHPVANREYLYTPDLVAKKDEEIYIIEVKVNTGKFDSEKEKRGFMLARDYGFIPMLITSKVDIEVTDLVIAEI